MSNKSQSVAYGSLKIRFSGAKLALSEPANKTPKFRVGWYINGSDINSASVRYRCFHFARVLEKDFDNVFFSKFKQLKAAIKDLDAIIIVKRLDRSTIDIAALARHHAKPLFLDLCDDVANPRYPTREDPYLSLTALLALTPALSGIVVPSAEMAGRIEGYLKDNGLVERRCHVIPDIAETREIFAATENFLRNKRLVSSSAHSPIGLPSTPLARSTLRKIIWFGNYGGSRSNFGIFSLKSRMSKLRDFHKKLPIELTVVSNNVTVYEALAADCGFPVRYVQWSPSSIYDELGQADVALLTTGTDEFCAVKSSNRVLQALAASVPVIVDRSPALAEFEDVIFAGNFTQHLKDCLGPDREAKVAPRLQLAASLLQRYTPECLASQWSTLLIQAIGSSLVERAARPRSGILMILDANDDPDDALAAIEAANSAPSLTYDLLVSLELLNENKAFNQIIRKARSLPMFFSGPLNGIEVQMAHRAAIVKGERGSVSSERISKIARELGLQVLTHLEAAETGLERFTNGLTVQTAPNLLLPPGPYPEHTEPDGSVEWAFVIHSKARGWILDAICQEIGSRQPKSWKVVDHGSPPPPSQNLFFSHFSLLDLYENKHAEALTKSKVFVWYTHPREENPTTVERNLSLFSRATCVIFTCESNRRLWIDRGLDPAKAVVVLGAADPSLFRRHDRGGGVVGLSSSFYERKNPDLLLAVVKALPHRNFVLLGRHWNRYARFEELLARPNFTYLTKPYRDYPRIYATFDVFLSISSLEGGPIPLIEAMMCNAVPVASQTGFAPDLIQHGHNGFLFDIGDGPGGVSELIEQAFDLDTDVRTTVERYSWDNFSSEIIGLAACSR